jgi:hypothetical protein
VAADVSKGEGPDRFTVGVAARPGLVGTLRVFASSVARHYGLSDDLVEDLKLAVSEASTDPIEAGAGGEISLAMLVGEDVVVCEVRSRSWQAVSGTPDLPEGVDPAALDRLQVVRALFGDAERSEHDGAVTVRFSTASRAAAEPSAG